MKLNRAIIHYDTQPVKIPNSIDDSRSGINVDPCAGSGDLTDDDKYVGQLNLNPNGKVKDSDNNDEMIIMMVMTMTMMTTTTTMMMMMMMMMMLMMMMMTMMMMIMMTE